ncbi:hypothetical protein NDU88_002120 [Pleurodeles waltl]|uniref:Uncharacterized protein n=1 Tax=Pleurodeles waltl TaxID=8319 RepID=A0AAV7MMV0_PLEWA|nr:hypothetical protein NDU88_002120 [Pleurodeles waltl]
MAYCGSGGQCSQLQGQECFSLVVSFSVSIRAQQTHGRPRGQQQLPDPSSHQSDTLWSQVEGDPVVTSPSGDTAPARMSSPRKVVGGHTGELSSIPQRRGSWFNVWVVVPIYGSFLIEAL